MLIKGKQGFGNMQLVSAGGCLKNEVVFANLFSNALDGTVLQGFLPAIFYYCRKTSDLRELHSRQRVNKLNNDRTRLKRESKCREIQLILFS
jgi:hypothetical protein